MNGQNMEEKPYGASGIWKDINYRQYIITCVYIEALF